MYFKQPHAKANTHFLKCFAVECSPLDNHFDKYIRHCIIILDATLAKHGYINCLASELPQCVYICTLNTNILKLEWAKLGAYKNERLKSCCNSLDTSLFVIYVWFY